jgi:asparagine synthase (glutamine-hydrolysing)
MCGIVGMVLRHGEVARWESEIVRSTDLMMRRGPDRAGTWSSPSGCVLGFRRLSILDLTEAGDQPMVTPDGRYALVFNGEVYNYRELRTALERRGVRFGSSGDAEVVLHALAIHGVQALDSFNGMFALALYDSHERRVLLARDHAGIKPLYVLHHPDGFFFASQFDQLLAHPWGRGRSIDPDALELYLNFGYLPAPAAMIEGAFAIEPGTWMQCSASGEVKSGRWFTFPKNPDTDLRGRDALEAVDAVVTAAVERQLVSDVPVGILLSGGIDSPLVAAKAQAASSDTLPAFTLGTDGTPEDESLDAATYARALSLRHVVRHITSDDVFHLLDDVVTACSEPLDDYSIFPTALVSRVAREEVTVVLSGDGGDDLFWGYPPRMIEPLVSPESLVNRLLGRSTRPAHTGANQLRMHRFVAREMLSSVFPGLRLDFPELPLFDFGGGDTDAVAKWVRWNEYSGHLVKVLQKVDRASMHSSLEVRVPLLDREVVDVAARVDWRECVDVGKRIGKLPLRAALRGHLPFQTMAKRGFEAPMSEWLRGPLRTMLNDLVSRPDVAGMPFEQSALQQVVERHQRRERESTTFLWRLLSLVLWKERHYDRPVVAAAAPAIEIS